LWSICRSIRGKLTKPPNLALRPALQPPYPAAVRRRYTAHPGLHSTLVADDVYDLFKRGTALLEAGEFHQATVPLSKAAAREPEKTSIREALGRAYFRSRQFEAARVEFEAVVDRAPTNDYALFCLGRALLELGRPAEARKPLALAAQLRPERRDYRIYRERAAKAA
jgi:tetratricopeptide (TPR) repeat protein